MRPDGPVCDVHGCGSPPDVGGSPYPVPTVMPMRAERSDVAVLLRTEHGVARVLASTSDEDNAHPRLLAAIGGALGWDFGALWVPADAEGSLLRCEHTWQGAFTAVAAFAEASRSVMLAPGQGLPGEVWRTGRPAPSEPGVSITLPRFCINLNWGPSTD